MRSLFFLLSAILLASFAFGQSVTELYQKKDYKALIQLERNAETLTADELYMVGFAFFRMEDDEKAITFYDKALAKGLNKGHVHFYKGLSLRFLKRLDEAMAALDAALALEPQNQEYMNEKGLIYYAKDDYTKALEVFEQAKKLPNTFPEPQFWIAQIYHEQKKLNQALPAFYEAIKILPQSNSHYVKALASIGLLEYTHTKNYKKSAEAYEKAIAIDKEEFPLYYKLIKSYNADKNFKKADSVFSIVKRAYESGKLPEDDMKFKMIAVHQFEWNGQTVTVHKALEEPKETLDISYKAYLLNKAGDKIERRFMVEKTIQIGDDGAKHLLCEQNKESGRHITYPYGWDTEQVQLAEVQKGIVLVLNKKIEPGASSNFGSK